ncbi:WGR domain-containing protein [Rhizobium oryzicola]|uniref:WGR domain-containing protein n=1 Tax=Rhizobium oryzicola TaxID=1232668 RepID=A0ABT8SYC5_9HYPH|nr:WGR domain-containing protein [Rhizobium oryzicola]MDO1582893.1 WGR domain-containing protein [Rhizobium oryzicola]
MINPMNPNGTIDSYLSLDAWLACGDDSGMAQHLYQIRIERIDRSCNMARFYYLSLQRDLFGAVCVVRNWGRLGTGGQSCTDIYDSEQKAIAALLALLRQKLRKGYRFRATAAALH